MRGTTTQPQLPPHILHQLVIYEQLLEGEEIWSQGWNQRGKQTFYDHLIETLGIMIKLDLCMILADICWRWSIPGSFLMMINDDVTIYLQ